MKYPNFGLEKKLISQGYQNIVGLDEVGRGAWAGPIVACATIITNFQIPCLRRGFGRQANPKQIPIFKLQISKQIKDSKLLTAQIREAMFEELSKQVIWSIGIVTHREIDRLGITKANILVMKRALSNLEIEPDYLLLDRVYGFKHQLPFQLIVDGDAKVLSIAIASILAKVTRDRMMREYHQKFPQYHFHRHKGYGTALHQKCLKQYGVCAIHRQSFRPVKIL
jgi:ribonuclease HII